MHWGPLLAHFDSAFFPVHHFSSHSRRTAALLTNEFNENNSTDPRIRSHSLGFGTPAVLTRSQSESLRDSVTTLVVDADCVARMSGATVYNAYLRAVSYDWTRDAVEDFDAVVPLLRRKPMMGGLLTDEAVAGMRADLVRRLSSQQVAGQAPAGAELKEVVLFPPGKVSRFLAG